MKTYGKKKTSQNNSYELWKLYSSQVQVVKEPQDKTAGQDDGKHEQQPMTESDRESEQEKLTKKRQKKVGAKAKKPKKKQVSTNLSPSTPEVVEILPEDPKIALISEAIVEEQVPDDQASNPSDLFAASSQTSQSSSIFDMKFESPANKVKSKRVGRMGGLQSSPSTQSQRVQNSTRPGAFRKAGDVARKMMPPQIHVQLLENAGLGKHSGPSKQLLESPTKKEILMVKRRQSTITYGKRHDLLLPPTTLRENIAPNDAKQNLNMILDGDSTFEKGIDEGLESSSDEDNKILGFHELVAAGNSKKYLDEINYLFEGRDRFSFQACFQIRYRSNDLLY
jgi:hypothetical protein